MLKSHTTLDVWQRIYEIKYQFTISAFDRPNKKSRTRRQPSCAVNEHFLSYFLILPFFLLFFPLSSFYSAPHFLDLRKLHFTAREFEIPKK